MHKYLIILGFTTALVLPTQAFSHEEDSHRVEFERVGGFGDIDANEDGIITEEEYLSYEDEDNRSDEAWRKDHWAEMMEKFDSNEDNALEMQEVTDYAERKVRVAMKKIGDWHGDWTGKFDFDGEEFDFDDEDFEMRFEGKMKGIEKKVYRVIKRLEGFGDHMGDFDFTFDFDGDHEMHEYAFTGKPHGFMFGPLHGRGLEGLDANEDGTISEEEFVKHRQDLFKKMDKNEDGVLDETELEHFTRSGNSTMVWIEDDEDEESDE